MCCNLSLYRWGTIILQGEQVKAVTSASVGTCASIHSPKTGRPWPSACSLFSMWILTAFRDPNRPTGLPTALKSGHYNITTPAQMCKSYVWSAGGDTLHVICDSSFFTFPLLLSSLLQHRLNDMADVLIMFLSAPTRMKKWVSSGLFNYKISNRSDTRRCLSHFGEEGQSNLQVTNETISICKLNDTEINLALFR